MTCERCQHFAAGELNARKPPITGDIMIGICRRFPPRPVSATYLSSVFPAVHKAHLCGEYEGGVPL